MDKIDSSEEVEDSKVKEVNNNDPDSEFINKPDHVDLKEGNDENNSQNEVGINFNTENLEVLSELVESKVNQHDSDISESNVTNVISNVLPVELIESKVNQHDNDISDSNDVVTNVLSKESDKESDKKLENNGETTIDLIAEVNKDTDIESDLHKTDSPEMHSIDLEQSEQDLDSKYDETAIPNTVDTNEIDILKTKITNLENHYKERDNTELDRLKTENNQLKVGLETSISKTTNLQKENETLKSINEDLKSEIRVKSDFSKKQLDEKKREKESLVLKYAQAEQKCLDSQKKSRDFEQKIKDLKSQLDQAHNEKERIQRDLKTRISDFSSYERELNNLKASITVLEQKLKSEETKFKDEIDKNKDVKKKNEELARTIVVLKEENNTLRTNCQEIVKTYQQSEDMKSNSLTNSLKTTKEELRKKENSYKELNDSHQKLFNELKLCKETISNNQQELNKTKERMKHIEADRLCQDESNKQLRDSIKSLTFIKEEQAERIKQLEPLEKKLENLNSELTKLKTENNDIDKQLKENEALMETISSKESEQLLFIQSLSDKNATLQSDKQTLLANQDKYQQQIDKFERTNKDLTVKLHYWEAKYKQESVNFEDVKQNSTKQVKDLELELRKLKNELSDAIDQNQSLQKKHKAHIKDLTKQLGKIHDKKQVMKTTSTVPTISADTISNNTSDRNLIERTNSSGGLIMLEFDSGSCNSQSKDRNNLINASTSVSDDSSSCKNSNPNIYYHNEQKSEFPAKSDKSQQHTTNPHDVSSHPVPNGNSDAVSSSNSSIDLSHQSASIVVPNNKHNFELLNTPEIHTINPQHQSMIDKIIRLQRMNAKLHEKIDFLNEHANQLTQEIQRKSILLRKLFCQSEESGSIKSEAFDNNHRMMARKSGIMASVFSSKQADQHMTLELSLEINRKLQSVLEDTAVKNITLKDSINTLGEEVSKLSQENNLLKQNHQ